MKRKAESTPKAGAIVSLPGPGKGPLLYPQGIEVLLRRAAAEPVFREQLIEQRAGAAAAIGLELDPAEKAMLESISRTQLLLTVERMQATGERRRGFLVKLAVASVVAAAATAGSIWLFRRREPSYQGKALSEWLVLGEQFGWSYVTGPVFIAGMMPVYGLPRNPPKPEMAQVEEALRAMGTNAIPPMLALLETKDPAWKLKLMNWLGKQSAMKIHFTEAETYQKRALIGLTVLGPLATNAIPAIQRAMAETNKLSDSVFQAYTREALAEITGRLPLRGFIVPQAP